MTAFTYAETSALKAFGENAMRAATRQDDAAYEAAHQTLEDFIDVLKRKYPERFWQDDDPAYKRMTKAWAKARR
jgi:hypothetical protein